MSASEHERLERDGKLATRTATNRAGETIHTFYNPTAPGEPVTTEWITSTNAVDLQEVR